MLESYPKWNIMNQLFVKSKSKIILTVIYYHLEKQEKEARKVTVVKVRDLIWRYLLKALPKCYGETCISCGETCISCGEDETSRRNSLKFDKHDKPITFYMVNYIPISARDVEWDKTIKIIEHLRRMEIKNLNLDHTWKIMKKLEKFSHVELKFDENLCTRTSNSLLLI
ncbi:hypothetical protein ACTFIZ_004552 [Dictyostelium cf. discoideum]